jgi:PTS system ascorbate-specific IIA component
MIGILIIAHDSFGEGLARAVTHVLGSRPPQFEVLSVAATDDPHTLLPAARELVKQLDSGSGVMIFSDIFGASPCNLAGKLLRSGRVEGIAGVNLPMLVRAFTYRNRDHGDDGEAGGVRRLRRRSAHERGSGVCRNAKLRSSTSWVSTRAHRRSSRSWRRNTRAMSRCPATTGKSTRRASWAS